MPLFSIVMPTRNRAHLLQYALQCARAQTFDDYEIVVCDNDSGDDTPDVAQRQGDRRVRYVRTDRTLPMPDNWEFALTHARGEYVTYLCDDDAISPHLLATLQGLIREGRPDPFVWGHCLYIHPSFLVEAKRNRLTCGSFTGSVREIPSRVSLQILYALREYPHAYPYPKMLNSCCSRRVIATVLREIGRFFLHTSPDYSACAAILAVADRYTHLDEPLLIAGAAPDSIGQSNLRRIGNPAGNTFFAEFGDPDSLYVHTPLRQASEINSVADTILRVRAAMPDRLGQYQLDWARYFGECYIRIQRTRRFGDDVAVYLQEFWRELRRQPRSVQVRVRGEIASHDLLSRLSGRPVELLRDPADLLKRATRKALAVAGVPGFRRRRPCVVDGGQAGFSNIAECAARLDTLLGGAPRPDPASLRPDQEPASRPR